MSLREKREFLQTEVLETDRLIALAGDHPLMTPALQQRKGELEKELKECELSDTVVTQAYERVCLAETREETVELRGTFRGATLDTWRFDFRTEADENISGRLGDEVSDEQALEMVHLTEQPCVGTFRRTVVTTRSGTLRTRHDLLALRSAEESKTGEN